MVCAIRKASLLSILFVVVLLAVAVIAHAQQPKKVRRIGYLSGTGNAANPGPYVGALRQGLRDLGYVEGKNIVIVWRDAYGKPDRQRALAVELVRLKVAVIVTGGSTSTRVAKEATATIPIIMTQDPDPIGNGFVASLARPGGNITNYQTLALS
jgi:putative ABC transport system substrate-binding protein